MSGKVLEAVLGALEGLVALKNCVFRRDLGQYFFEVVNIGCLF